MSDGTALATWDPNSGAALPAYMADAAAAFGGSNIPDRLNVPSLSYEGKVWQIVLNGQKTPMQSKNEDGDMIPVSIMRVVLLNCNPVRGRAYYPGAYDPAKAMAPKCWSGDGKAPDASVTEKENPTCQGCPQSIKGSKIDTNGKEMVACSEHRMVALVPAFSIGHEPLRMKLAVTSDYAKEVVEHGWFALRQYLDFLKQRGIVHTGMVVTKMKFDASVAYPKVLFSLDRLLDPAEIQQAVKASQDPRVAKLLAETWTAAGVNGTPVDDSDIAPDDGSAAIARAEADGWVAHPTPGYHYKGQDVVETVTLAAQYPAPAAPPIPEASAPPPIPASEAVIDATAKVVDTAPVAQAPTPLDLAEADGWTAHPTPGYHYKGQEVVATDEVAARYAVAPEAPAAPPAPPPAPEPEPAPVDGLALASADGWAAHPTAEGWWFKGTEVVATDDVRARYAGNGANAGTAAPSAPAATPESGSQTSAAGQTATTGASPSSDAIPADVTALLSEWIVKS